MQTTVRRCEPCGKALLLPLGRDKWGQCATCMAIALVGTIGSWSMTLSFWMFHSRAPITVGLTSLAGAFTVVLVIHLLAYRRRSLTPPATPAASGGRAAR